MGIMAEQRPAINILPAGWDYPGWVGDFYPDDLPQEWQLAYFANEFPGVMVRQQVWLRRGAQTWNAWHADVGETFRFYLEVNQSVNIRKWVDAAGCLETNFGGFVVDLQWLERAFAQAFLQDSGLNCYTLFPKGSTTRDIQRRSLDKLRVAFLLTTSELTDLKSQRRLLEKFAELVDSEAEVLLFLVGEPPMIDKLRDLRTLAQLLGLA